MKDMYGNEVQQATPTTRLLETRKKKAESNGGFKLATKINEPMNAGVVADYLRSAAKQLEASGAARVLFEFKAEEVGDKRNGK